MELNDLPDPFVFLTRVCCGFTHEELLMTEMYFDTLKLMNSTKEDEETAIQCGVLIPKEEFDRRVEEGNPPMFCIVKTDIGSFMEYRRDDFREFWERIKIEMGTSMDGYGHEDGYDF